MNGFSSKELHCGALVFFQELGPVDHHRDRCIGGIGDVLVEKETLAVRCDVVLAMEPVYLVPRVKLQTRLK
jgi:hypothetical protein